MVGPIVVMTSVVSERLYGIKRYPLTLRMLSREVDDVMDCKVPTSGCLGSQVPHCYMPAPEAEQVLATPAYMHDRRIAEEFLQRALRFREGTKNYEDCSTVDGQKRKMG